MLVRVLLALALPRIVPVPMSQARRAVVAWGGSVPAAGDLGAIGMVHGRALHAVAVVERVAPDHLHVWCVACDDAESGTRLLRALVHVAPGFTHDLDGRWAVALKYFRS